MKTPCAACPIDRRVVGILVSLAGGLAGAPAFGQTFTGVGFMPGGTRSYVGDVSSDGSVVVGTGNTPGGDRVFRWTRGGVAVSLGTLPGGYYSNGGVVSHDGSVVVGTSSATVGTRAFRWTQAGGMVDLGTLPPAEGGLMSFGYGVSGNGEVIAGMGDDNDSPQLAIRWSSAGGMVRVGTLGGPYSIAQAANLDGSVIVGDGTFANGNHAFRWTTAGGIADLGTLPGGGSAGAWAVSDDGAVAAGHSTTNIDGFFRVRATRWITDGGGATTALNLGVLPGVMYSRGYGVSNDGAVVVGLSGNNVTNERATLWNASMGLVDLNTYLPTLGINLTHWTLTSARAVSGDGLTIVGNGTHNGVSEGWVATIPPPAACFTLSGPASASACAGGSATFSATPIGAGPFTYRWRRNAASIDTGVHPSAATATLLLTGVSSADAGSYDCVVSNACTTLTSSAAALTVATCGGPADMNCDGVVDFFDIDPFLLALFNPAAYTAAYPNCDLLNADCNNDDAVDFFDIDPFLNCLFGGCP